MDSQSINDILCKMSNSIGVSIEKLKEYMDGANKKFVFNESDLKMLQESMVIAAEAGTDYRKQILNMSGSNVIGSRFVPQGHVLKYDKPDFDSISKPIQMPVEKPYQSKLYMDIQLKNTGFIFGSAPVKKIDYSKVFQFRIRKAPRYLKRFR